MNDQRNSGSIVPPILVLGIAGIVAGLVLFLSRNENVDAELASPTGGLNGTLALAGSSSRPFPESVAIESLRTRRPEGFELVSRALRKGVIDSFRQVSAPVSRARFQVDGGPKTLTFSRNGMVIGAVNFDRKQSNQLSGFALSLYGYETGFKGFDELVAEMDALYTMIPETVTLGSSFPEAEAEANSLESEWKAWLARNRGSILPRTRQIAEANLVLAQATAGLASNVTDASLDTYNAALGDLNSLLN